MQVSMRCWLGIVSVVGLSLVLVACGEDKKEPVPVEPAAADEAEKSAGAEAPAPSAYVIPEALSYKQSRAEYGRGKMRAAKKKNTEALKLRKKKDSEGAIASYKEALELSPGYVTARFNLACEYARFGKADEAIAELEHLFKMGTTKAMRKIAKLQVDSDFDPIREDSRIKDIVKSFAVDFDEPFFKQICGNEGKILTVMDAKEGLYGISARMDSRGGAIRGKATLVKGGKARTKVFNTLNMVCGDGKIIRDETQQVDREIRQAMCELQRQRRVRERR